MAQPSLPYQSKFFIRSNHKSLHKSCLMHCGGIFKPCCSYSETIRPNMQNTHIENNAPPSFGYLENHRFSTKDFGLIMKLTFAFLFAIVSFQTNFQETSNAKSLAVIYCLAFISVWLFNDLNTKYISRAAQRCQRENEYRNG